MDIGFWWERQKVRPLGRPTGRGRILRWVLEK
jgi:hypothetical protein